MHRRTHKATQEWLIDSKLLVKTQCLPTKRQFRWFVPDLVGNWL